MTENLGNATRRGCVSLLVLTLVWCWPATATETETNRPASEQTEPKLPDSVPAEEPTSDPWAPFRLLEGHWEGAIEGILGQGTGKRSYERILDDKYVLMRHASVRLPQEKSPKGDFHRGLTIFSFDSERDTIVMRSFMVEGFVLRYTCEVEPKRFVCNTESIENGTGMRARETIEITDRYRFEETFELASPGQELTVFFTNSWTRVPDLAD